MCEHARLTPGIPKCCYGNIDWVRNYTQPQKLSLYTKTVELRLLSHEFFHIRNIFQQLHPPTTSTGRGILRFVTRIGQQRVTAYASNLEPYTIQNMDNYSAAVCYVRDNIQQAGHYRKSTSLQGNTVSGLEVKGFESA